jgi:hypothetical protein
MDPVAYQAFTDQLQQSIEQNPRVIGLMAAGSMARSSHEPDEWSDHDFWVVVEPGEEGQFVTRTDWLPDGDQIVLYFRHPVYGALKALYPSGHLLDFAVSDRSGLSTAKINDYRLLIDRADLAADLARIQNTISSEHALWTSDDMALIGEFMAALLVGVWRYRRGERLSSRQFITMTALQYLLHLIAKHIPSEHAGVLDNLDPLRRFEIAYPEIAQKIDTLLQLELLQAATGLLDLAENLLRERLDVFPTAAAAIIRDQIRATVHTSGPPKVPVL